MLEGATLKVCYINQALAGRARRSVPCVQVVTKCCLHSIRCICNSGEPESKYCNKWTVGVTHHV